MGHGLYESASSEMLTEIMREAECLLDEQLATAVAADQRALTFAGLLVAAVAALIGAIASLHGAITVPIVFLATILTLAAIAAFWSARPTAWRFRGNAPHEWAADIEAERDLQHCLAEMVDHYDNAAFENYQAIKRAAWAMRISMTLTGLALIGAMAWAWSIALWNSAGSPAPSKRSSILRPDFAQRLREGSSEIGGARLSP